MKKNDFQEEQELLYEKLIKNLDVAENNTFTVYDMSEETEKNIQNLMSYIKKYYFSKDYSTISRSKNTTMSIINFIIKKNNKALYKNEFRDDDKIKRIRYAIIDRIKGQ